MEEWKSNLIDDDDGIRQILANTRTIAVLGMRPESKSDRPAFYVPAYMQRVGFRIIPVPVADPEVETILGEPTYRSLAEIPEEVDLVNVFRRSTDIPAHVQDIIAKCPAAVWFQLGIRNDDAARRLAREGIKVVQDHCIMVDHRRLL